MVELLEQVPVNLICVAVLGALCLRKLVRMDKYHCLRVVILTVLLWVPALYLFSLCCPPEPEFDYVPTNEEPRVFYISEY